MNSVKKIVIVVKICVLGITNKCWESYVKNNFLRDGINVLKGMFAYV